jgi:hypothetical protein
MVIGLAGLSLGAALFPLSFRFGNVTMTVFAPRRPECTDCDGPRAAT